MKNNEEYLVVSCNDLITDYASEFAEIFGGDGREELFYIKTRGGILLNFCALNAVPSLNEQS